MNQMSMEQPQQKRINIDVNKMERLLKEDGFLSEEINHIKMAIDKSSKRIIKSFNSLRN